MGNTTSLPTPEILQHEVQTFFECIHNVSSLADHTEGWEDLDGSLTRRFLSFANDASTSREKYLAYEVGIGLAAGVLLMICALLAGLTLAICGLDDTLIQLKAATGTPKER